MRWQQRLSHHMQLLIMHCIGHSATGGLAACLLLRTGQGGAHVYEATILGDRRLICQLEQAACLWPGRA